MTTFFAAAAEVEQWLQSAKARLDLRSTSDTVPGGLTRTYLWPQEVSLPPGSLGVQVWHPEEAADVIAAGSVGFKASAFPEDVAQVGRRLVRSLTRSLRSRAIVPLYAMSLDGTSISGRPAGWGTADAVDGRRRLRQFRNAGCYYVTADVTVSPRALPSEDDRSLYEGDGLGRA